MREYILYVILVFLPIGAIMAYLLQREGVSRRNTAIVVVISWLIIVTFPLSIAKLGTFIALLTYIVAILVMTRYLLGNKKEFVVESKGTLVTGTELEHLMVNLERQGYNISTDASGNFVSIGDEQAINSMLARQTAETGTAEIPEPAYLFTEVDNAGIDNNEIPIEDITQETAGDAVTKLDVSSQLEPEAAEALPADISDKVYAEEEIQESLTPEPAAEAAPVQPDAAGGLLGDRTLEEPGELTIKDSKTGDRQEDIVIPEEIEIDDLASKIRDASDSPEILQVVPEQELEPWTEPGAPMPVTDEEPHPEEFIEALPEETVAKISIEPEKEAEQAIDSIPVESISEAIAGELAAEIPEAEDMAETELAEQPLPAAAEDSDVAGPDVFEPDVFEKESETWTESDDAAKIEETTAEIVRELEQEEVEKVISEASGSEIEEPVDAETIDEIIEAKAQELEQLAEVMPNSAQIPAEPDLDETSPEAVPLKESILMEIEKPATAGVDLAETEIIDILESDSTQSREEMSIEPEVELTEPESRDTIVEAEFAAEAQAAAALDVGDAEPAESLESDSDQSFEEVVSGVEVPAAEMEIEDVQTIDEAVEEETQEAEQLAEVMPETDQIPAEPDLDEIPVEAVPLMESIVVEAEESSATGLDLVETEIIDTLESESVESRKEASSELEVEFTEPESQDKAIEAKFAAEPEVYEITGELDVETEKPEPGLVTDEAHDVVYSAEPQELPEPVENLADRAEPIKVEVAEESADATEVPLDPEPLTDQIKEPDSLLFELIDRGFALKEMGSWQEAGQCFMDADALTEDAELKELLNMEIVAIFQLLS